MLTTNNNKASPVMRRPSPSEGLKLALVKFGYPPSVMLGQIDHVIERRQVWAEMRRMGMYIGEIADASNYHHSTILDALQRVEKDPEKHDYRKWSTRIQFCDVIDVVCDRERVSFSEIAGRGRHKEVVRARELIVLLTRRLTRSSFPEMARRMGRPNHSTTVTMHARALRNGDDFHSRASQLEEYVRDQASARLRSEQPQSFSTVLRRAAS